MRNIKKLLIAATLTLGFNAAASAMPDFDDRFDWNVKASVETFGCTKDGLSAPAIMLVYPSITDMERLSKKFVFDGRVREKLRATWSDIAAQIDSSAINSDKKSDDFIRIWREKTNETAQSIEDDTEISVIILTQYSNTDPALTCR